jgi:hypothetical protein
MVVVRGADVKSVNLISHLIDHIAIVGELDRLGMLAQGNVETTGVNVASGHHVAMTGSMVEVALAFASYADACNLETIVSTEDTTREKSEGECRGSGSSQECAARVMSSVNVALSHGCVDYGILKKG